MTFPILDRENVPSAKSLAQGEVSEASETSNEGPPGDKHFLNVERLDAVASDTIFVPVLPPNEGVPPSTTFILPRIVYLFCIYDLRLPAPLSPQNPSTRLKTVEPDE